MTKWEYREFETDPLDNYTSILNRLGEEGWELVAVVPPNPRNPYIQFHFKRPKQPSGWSRSGD